MPLWFVVGLVLALPTHFIAWSWFLENGVDLVRLYAAEIITSPSWLTSTLYFPLGLIGLALTEFAAMLPLNFVVLIFGVRQYFALRDSKHFVSYRGSGFAH